jgi:hypothetical protein
LRDTGFGYTVALTDAIRAATDSVAATNPEAFTYRRADLRGAVERSLYILLASHAPLVTAYSEGAAPPPLGSWIADLTGARLVGRGQRGPRRNVRSLAARALFKVRSLLDRAPPTHRGDGPVCFVLDHPKYLRFIAPIREHMGLESTVMATHSGEGVDRLLDSDDQGRPRGRAVGRALWGFPSLLHTYDRLLAALADAGAGRAVAIEGMSPLDELAAAAARRLGISSICVQQGWSPLIHAGFRGMGHTTMAVWGEGFAELLAPHNPGVRFAVTGNPALDAELSTGRLRATIGDSAAVAFFLQSTSAWIREEHLRGFHELVTETAAALPETVVLVREHPGAPLSDDERRRMSSAENVRLVPAPDWSLREVLEAADLNVSIYSTSLLEGAALGTPAVIFNPTSLPPLEPDLVRLGAATRAASVDAAREQIAAGLNDPGERERLREGTAVVRDRYFAGGDAADAAKRIAALVDGGSG